MGTLFTWQDLKQSVTRSLTFWAPLALALTPKYLSAARAHAHIFPTERRSRSRSWQKWAPLTQRSLNAVKIEGSFFPRSLSFEKLEIEGLNMDDKLLRAKRAKKYLNSIT